MKKLFPLIAIACIVLISCGDSATKEKKLSNCYNKESAFDYRFVFSKYNAYGDWGEKIQYNEYGDKVSTILNTYNNLGHLTELFTIVVKEVKIGETTTADEDSEEEEEVEVPGELTISVTEGSGQAYEYVYDEHNNWIQKITYKISGNDIAETGRDRQFYYERVITYK